MAVYPNANRMLCQQLAEQQHVLITSATPNGNRISYVPSWHLQRQLL